jgi:hypothetical protein
VGSWCSVAPCLGDVPWLISVIDELVEQGLGEADRAVGVVCQCEDDEAGPLVGNADELGAQAGPASAMAVDAATGVTPDTETPRVVEGGRLWSSGLRVSSTRHSNRRAAPASAKWVHMQARFWWSSRSFHRSSAGVGQHSPIRARSTLAWGIFASPSSLAASAVTVVLPTPIGPVTSRTGTGAGMADPPQAPVILPCSLPADGRGVEQRRTMVGPKAGQRFTVQVPTHLSFLAEVAGGQTSPVC